MIRKGLTFDDVLLVPNYTGELSRKDVTTETNLGKFQFGIPIISANMDTVTGHEMARKMGELGGLGILHRAMNIQENVDEFKKAYSPAFVGKQKIRIGVSIGANEREIERAEALYDSGAYLFNLDVAHGHSKVTGKMLKMLREKFRDEIYIIAGNVATLAGADYLASCGADCIKVGIGPGSACTTRIKTGCGVPQLTAIMDCRRVDRDIIADGGIRYPGDIVKALAAGANMVMVGGILAGTDETPGEFVWKNNTLEPDEEPGDLSKAYKIYRGMASKEAQNDLLPEWKTSEGISFEVPYNGSVTEIIKDLLGGLRSGLTYTGARDIKELQKKAEFIEVTPAGTIENTPHGDRRM